MQLRHLQRYWDQHPPTHLLVDAIVIGLGGERKSETEKPAAKKADPTAEELRAIMSQFNM